MATATEAPPLAPAPETKEKRPPRRRGRWTPYLLLLPGLLWLVVFFLVPILTSVVASVQTGNADQGYQLTWAWGNYGHGYRYHSHSW